MKNKLIGNFSFIALMVTIMCSSFFGVGIYCLIRSSAVDSWISVIIAFFITLVALFIYIYVASYEPDLSIRDKIIRLYGKKIGFIFNLLICILFFLVGVNLMYNLTNFIVSQYLSQTPLYIIGIAFSILIIYINIKNIECISRTSTILFYIILMFIFLIITNLFPKVEIDNFKPILQNGIKDSIIGSLFITTINFTIMFLMLIIPKNRIQNSKKYNKVVIISYIMAFVIIFILTVTTIGNLGIYIASYYQYPEYMVLKKITLFSFLNRIENIFTITWIFGIFITLTMVVYYISNTIKFNNKSKGLPSLIILGILLCSLKFFKNNTVYNNYNYKLTPYLRAIILILFLIIAISIFIKKKILKSKNNLK